MDISFHCKDLYIFEHRHWLSKFLSRIYLSQYHDHYWTGDHTEKAPLQQAPNWNFHCLIQVWCYALSLGSGFSWERDNIGLHLRYRGCKSIFLG